MAASYRNTWNHFIVSKQITMIKKEYIVTQQKLTEWEITKTEVGNKTEIFIILTKYNTCQRREEGKQLLVMTT